MKALSRTIQLRHFITVWFTASLVVSWCFEPSQPQRITSGLKTNFSVAPSYSINIIVKRSAGNKEMFTRFSLTFDTHKKKSLRSEGYIHRTSILLPTAANPGRARIKPGTHCPEHYIYTVPLGRTPMGNSGCSSAGKASCEGVALPNLRCTLGVFVFQHLGTLPRTLAWITDNVRTDVNACGCTRGCTGSVRVH